MPSYRCVSEKFWNVNRCVPCEQEYTIMEGFEFNPHCGRSDDGGFHKPVYKNCGNGTFNNGSFVKCQSCSTCPNWKLLSPCTPTTDTRCCEDGQGECRGFAAEEKRTMSVESVTSVDTSHTTEYKTTAASTYTPSQPSLNHIGIGLGAVFTTLICVCLIYLLYKSKHRSCRGKQRFNGRSFKNVTLEDDSCLTYPPREENAENFMEINDLLSPDIQAASLQTVLNNMDVVEELVLLLDPDTPGVKSTRHLAAKCSIPFTWINYAYSMKDSRSPLIAMLERVIASHPHWNVGHFAGLLRKIGRNDAVIVLTKLALTAVEV